MQHRLTRADPRPPSKPATRGENAEGTPAQGTRSPGKVQNVLDLYPLWEIVEGVALTEDGGCEIGVRLELPSRLFLEEHALLTQHGAVKTMLQQGVPVDARLRVYLSVEPEQPAALERVVAPPSRYETIDRLHQASQALLHAKLEGGQVKRWNAFATLRVRPPVSFSKDAA